MSVGSGLEDNEPKGLPPGATPKEKLKFIREMVLFHKQIFMNLSYNDMQALMDKIIEVGDDRS